MTGKDSVKAATGFFALLISTGIAMGLLAPWPVTRWYLAVAGIITAVLAAQAIAGRFWDFARRPRRRATKPPWFHLDETELQAMRETALKKLEDRER